jgi:hypothetical protein
MRRRDGEFGKSYCSVLLRLGAIAMGDVDDGSFFEGSMPHAFIYLIIFHLQVFYAMFIACFEGRGSGRLCGFRIFFQVSYLLFRLIFSPYFFTSIHVEACTFVCVYIGWRRRLSGGGHVWAYWARAQNGCTALILAATAGHTDFMHLLLAAGADTNATDEVRASAGDGVCGVLREDDGDV